MSAYRHPVVLALLVALMSLPAQSLPASAAPPGNDDIANATVIPSLPFTATAELAEATSAQGEACATDRSVWYRYTAEVTGPLEATLNAYATNDVTVAVFSGEPDALTLLGCERGDPFLNTQARVMFDATAGTTYHVQVGALAGSMPIRVRHATKPFPVIARAGQFYVREAFNTGVATSSFRYGSAGDRPVFGDWDGDGRSTVGVVRGNTWYLRNENGTGVADIVFRYGRVGDIPVVGDWGANGVDTPGVVRGNTWYLRYSNTQGVADRTLRFGLATDVPVPGDWQGTGGTVPGVFREGVWYFQNIEGDTVSMRYGTAGDRPIIGDWNGDDVETPGVIRGNTWHLRNTKSTGVADLSFRYGSACDPALILTRALTRFPC